ncbi:MAG: rod shape-determining protein [Lachnospiraceae bacterium]|jgi:rod shape-determining protein MreB|nr:rod shape-determining protein [Lachnospiraceae bacterium]MBR3575563.1 rod shape-determining protein [Lachnospiraceae bacterium]MCR5739637.1 rod shape-determining protein [Lachnospiraceae bacterium]
MAANAYGIDLGTNHIKIFNNNDSTITIQKNMIAIKDESEFFAYGDSAYEMHEKAPSNIQISYPLSCGVISDLRNVELLVKYMITDIQGGTLKSADFLIAVPYDITDVEKRAFYDLLKEAGIKAHRIYVTQMAIADGIGMGIDVKNAVGVLVVNVGFETTEISVLSLGGIVLSKLIKEGGLKFDDSIRAAVRNEFGLMIGGKTAEDIKKKLKDLEKEGKGALVYGRDIVTGLPVQREIPTKLIVDSLEGNYKTIIDNIKFILERTPPELSADIFRNGIYLTGGASQVSHLVERIADGTGLKVNITDEPITSTAYGLGRIIQDPDYAVLAQSAEGMGK